MLEPEDIRLHIDNHLKPWLDAKLLLNSKLLIGVGIRKRVGKDLEIVANCLQVSRPKEKPHQIEVRLAQQLDTNAKKYKIINVYCTCTGGSTGKCKHSTAVLRYLSKHNEDELQVISCTDQKCSWDAEVKAVQDAVTNPIPLQMFCHYKKETPSTDLPPIGDFFNSQEFNLIKQACVGMPSAFFQHMEGRETNVQDAFNSNTLERFKPIIPLISSCNSDFPDELITLQYLENLSKEEQDFFFQFIVTDQKKSLKICGETVSQAKCNIWKKERKLRITASYCHEFQTYKKNANPNWPKKLKSKLFSSFKGNTDTEFGRKHENTSLAIYASEKKCHIMRLGLIININIPFLGCSPDGIVQNNGIPELLLEVKCPKIGRITGGFEFLKNLPYLNHNESNNTFHLKKNHPYFAQIQMSLCLLNLEKAQLVVYCHYEKKNYIIDVQYDSAFSSELLLDLTDIYFKHMIPFLLDNVSELCK